MHYLDDNNLLYSRIVISFFKLYIHKAIVRAAVGYNRYAKWEARRYRIVPAMEYRAMPIQQTIIVSELLVYDFNYKFGDPFVVGRWCRINCQHVFFMLSQGEIRL